ncbi:MAG TPA: hypothetical protein VLQ93_23285 [Myxococcaceae bacterium]|nr:hypothetical protein [Myxococcaceae bacterium]
MMSLVAVLLAVTPVPGQASLLESPLEESPSAVRLLVSQAEEDSREERIRELTREVDALNQRLRGLSSNWPTSSLLMSYAGYVLAPLLLPGIPLLIAGLALATEFATVLVTVGAVLTGVGGAGVALLVVGLVTGFNAVAEARSERERLIQERSRLEDELRELKSAGSEEEVGRPTVGSLPVVAFSF